MAHGIIKDQIKGIRSCLSQEAVAEEVPRQPDHRTPFAHAIASAVRLFAVVHLGLVLGGAADRLVRIVEPEGVVAPGREEEDVVASAAAGDEGRLPRPGGVRMSHVRGGARLRGKAVAVGQLAPRRSREDLVQGQARPAPVPGREALAPEGVPLVSV